MLNTDNIKKIAKETAIAVLVASIFFALIYCAVMANIEYFTTILNSTQIEMLFRGGAALAVVIFFIGTVKLLWTLMIRSFRRIFESIRNSRNSQNSQK